MRFIEAGPDIPNDLLVAQERGETLFVCGAGVSRTTGLPLFRALVAGVYGRLGEDWAHHPAEREGMTEGGELFGQYDRVLRCLERRLAASEAPRNRNMRARIRNAVREELVPPEEADLSNHLALLELSRNAQGDSRLLTTNFDTLFERAWLKDRGKIACSYAGVALPRPMTAGFSGVLHLHGRLADAEVQVDETDLVLTSAEFGDAYLRSGWASRYVYDLARTHTLVLVGYQADDPPMRYLLEALEADRELYPDLRKVYAFGEHADDDAELKDALWRAKGVEPILYRAEGAHELLYSSLREWSRYAVDPTAWRREQLRRLLEAEPLPSESRQIDQCVALLDRGDANQLLGELSPDPSWLPVLVQRGVFKNQLPDAWIAGRVNDPEMIRACAELGRLDDQTRWRIERAMEQARGELSAVREQAWRLLLSVRPEISSPMNDRSWYDWQPLIRRGNTNFEAREAVADILTPRLKIGKSFWWGDDEEQPPAETLDKLVSIEMEVADHPSPSEILETWPDTIEDGMTLFGVLERSLLNALEQASDLGMTGDWDSPSRDVPSIAEHVQNTYRGGFNPIVRSIASLWQRIAQHDPAQAKLLALNWRDSPFVLFRRLYIFALADQIWAADEAAQAVVTLGDEVFWGGQTQVEVMRLVAGRWSEFGEAQRDFLEERLCRGVPAAFFPQDVEDDDETWTSIKDDSIFRRIKRILSSGGNLSPRAQQLLAEIEERHPGWTPGLDDRDDFTIWHEERFGPDGHPELLSDVEDDSLVQETFRLQQEKRVEEGDLWRVFCTADPERALRGLTHESEAGRWEPNAWRYLLWAASEKGSVDFQRNLAAMILIMPAAELSQILHAATSWMARQRELLSNALDGAESRLLAVWDRLAELAFDDQTVDIVSSFDGDVIAEAINRPGGDLAKTLLDELASKGPENDSGLGAELEPRFMRVVEARNRAGLLGLVCLSRDLAFLDAIAPHWTSEHLTHRLDWTSDHSLPLWQAYAHGRIGSARLFNALKAPMLQAFERKGLSARALEGLFGKLFAVVCRHRLDQWHDYVLTTGEVKRVLTIAPSEVRQNAAWKLWRMMGDEEVVDKSAHWRNLVKPVLLDIWPLDAAARGKGTSEKLVLMALECGDSFSDAVETISDFLVPYRLYGLSHALRLERSHHDLFRANPRAFVRLANALIDPDQFPVPNDLPQFLEDCLASDAELADDPGYIRLYGLRRQLNA